MIQFRRLLPQRMTSHQFVTDVLDPNIGGASRTVLVRKPTSPGYYVSRSPLLSLFRGGSQETISQANVPVPEYTRFVRRDLVRNLKALPSTPLREWLDVHQGGWLKNGSIYVDTSDKVTDLSTAVAHALARNQIAVFDANNFNEIGVLQDVPGVRPVDPRLASTLAANATEIMTPGLDPRTELARSLLRPVLQAQDPIKALESLRSDPNLQAFVPAVSSDLTTGIAVPRVYRNLLRILRN